MAMVIMSPLSELTDTDGFEMRSISQRAPRAPPPAPALLLPSLSSTSKRRVGLPPADCKAKFNSMSAAEAPVTHSWTPSGAPAPPRNPPLHVLYHFI